LGGENIQHYDNNEKNTTKLTQKEQFLRYSEKYFSLSTIPGQKCKTLVY